MEDSRILVTNISTRHTFEYLDEDRQVKRLCALI